MKKIFVLSLICVFSLLAAGVHAEGDTAALYKSKCAGCHGDIGEKETGGVQAFKGRMDSTAIAHCFDGYLDGTYGGKTKMIMKNTLAKLTPEERAALASYCGTL